jgi:hypothetical protein
MSWGAHQFEIYAVQAQLPRRMRGRVSFIGVALAAAAVGPRVRRLLAGLGIVGRPDPEARRARTAAFLRELDLDPAAILGRPSEVMGLTRDSPRSWVRI